MTRRLAAFLIFTSCAFAQLDSNSVSVTVSRNTALQPDQALFTVAVTSDLNTTLSDVLTAVHPGGLTLANFSSAAPTIQYVQNGAGTKPQQLNQSIFALTTIIGNIKGTTENLTAIQKSVSQNSSGLTLSFSLQGTQVSSQLAQSQTCDIAGLLADA